MWATGTRRRAGRSSTTFGILRDRHVEYACYFDSRRLFLSGTKMIQFTGYRFFVGLFALLALLSVFSTNCGAQEPARKDTTADRLKSTIVHLSETIGERNLRKPAKLAEAADYIQKTMESMQYKIERQSFDVVGFERFPCHNLIAEVLGKDKPKEIVLIGAHYDSAQGTPGANDNGSGTAALIEIANQMRGRQFSQTVRFVFFTNEEPPFFQRDGQMGSWVYAKACRQRGDTLKLVMSLETMGYFTDVPDSQKYPPLLAALYPSTGNFIGLVSDVRSRPMLLDVEKRLRKQCEVDVQIGSLPSELQGVGWSDHWSFWQEGYMGLMVTDTALFRYPHYHQPTDTVDKIEFVRFSQVVDGLAKMIEDLAK